MLVYHPDDKQCAETREIYQSFLKPKDRSFLDYPLDKLIKVIEPQLEGDYQQNWLSDFKNSQYYYYKSKYHSGYFIWS